LYYEFHAVSQHRTCTKRFYRHLLSAYNVRNVNKTFKKDVLFHGEARWFLFFCSRL